MRHNHNQERTRRKQPGGQTLLRQSSVAFRFIYRCILCIWPVHQNITAGQRSCFGYGLYINSTLQVLVIMQIGFLRLSTLDFTVKRNVTTDVEHHDDCEQVFTCVVHYYFIEALLAFCKMRENGKKSPRGNNYFFINDGNDGKKFSTSGCVRQVCHSVHPPKIS